MGGEHVTVLHAYGVVDARWRPDLPAGLGDSPVSTLDLVGLGLLVSRLDGTAYGPRVWAEQGQDLGWLGRVAAEHHRVLQAAAEQGDVVPLRLAPSHRDEAALRTALEPLHDELTEALARLHGRVELGVKAYAGSAPDPGRGTRPGAPTTGREYLTRRSRAARDELEHRQAQDRAATEVHRTLSQVAAGSRSNPVQDPALSGRQEPMLLNGAYLVPRAEVDGFGALVGRLGETAAPVGLLLECTGPWAPYNFVPRAADEGESP